MSLRVLGKPQTGAEKGATARPGVESMSCEWEGVCLELCGAVLSGQR